MLPFDADSTTLVLKMMGSDACTQKPCACHAYKISDMSAADKVVLASCCRPGFNWFTFGPFVCKLVLCSNWHTKKKTISSFPLHWWVSTLVKLLLFFYSHVYLVVVEALFFFLSFFLSICKKQGSGLLDSLVIRAGGPYTDATNLLDVLDVQLLSCNLLLCVFHTLSVLVSCLHCQ